LILEDEGETLSNSLQSLESYSYLNQVTAQSVASPNEVVLQENNPFSDHKSLEEKLIEFYRNIRDPKIS
jgi:hypothetical protein